MFKKTFNIKYLRYMYIYIYIVTNLLRDPF